MAAPFCRGDACVLAPVFKICTEKDTQPPIGGTRPIDSYLPSAGRGAFTLFGGVKPRDGPPVHAAIPPHAAVTPKGNLRYTKAVALKHLIVVD